MMKKTLICSVLLAIVPALGFSQTAFAVRNTATWIEAVGGIRSGGNNKGYTITVTGNINIPSSTESTFGSVTGITVTIDGGGTLSPSANGALLNIGNEQTVIVKDVILQGRSTNNPNSVVDIMGGVFRMEGKASVTGNIGAGGVYIAQKGTFTMKDSASVSGNIRSNSEGGGGVTVNRGTFIMQDSAKVSGNTCYGGSEVGGVYVGRDSTFTMDGGTISDNTSSGGGSTRASGVGLDNGTFTMKGGTISNVLVSNGNFTMESGAISGNKNEGVTLYKGGTFTMKDGTISGNKNEGVCLAGGRFTMEGGVISGNTGGGVNVYGGGRFTMQGGAISGNKADEGGGVRVSEGTFIMEGGVISGNTALKGGGVYVGNYFGAAATFAKPGGTVYGDDAEQNLKNTALSRIGNAVYEKKNGSWRNATAGTAMNIDSYGFWLNDGDVVMFPSGFAGDWIRFNFNNKLTITENTIKSSSSDFVWVLQKISGNAYTLKRADAANTMTLTIRLDGYSLVISGDSGSGENNWNGTWHWQKR